MLLTWQFPSIGHSAFFLQLHFGLWSCGFEMTFLLCPLMIFDIVHATVADFNCIAVENFVKLVASWEMFCYQLQECLCNVRCNGFAKGWVKPYVSLSRFWFFWFVVGVFQINLTSLAHLCIQLLLYWKYTLYINLTDKIVIILYSEAFHKYVTSSGYFTNCLFIF